MRRKQAREIPPCYLNVRAIANKADTAGMLTYDSVIDDHEAVLICDGEGVLIVTRDHGYLRMNRDAIPHLIEELENVVIDMSKNIWRAEA